VIKATDLFGLNDSAWNNKGSTTVASFVGFTAPVWQSGAGDSLVGRCSVTCGCVAVTRQAPSLFSIGIKRSSLGPSVLGGER